jgi:hypothetical protein
MSLGTKFCSFQMTWFWLLVIWVSSLFSLLLFFSQLLCVGVDNALIKGEIASTWLICALVVRICDE